MKGTSKKTTAKRAASKRAASKTAEVKAPQPMDPGAPETTVAEPSTTQQRVCWAIKTLCEEVWDLFPETPVEYSNYNGRGVALDVTFDVSTFGEEDQLVFLGLLELLGDSAYNEDKRIEQIITHGTEAQVLVSMHNNPRTQDSRDPFGLSEAYAVLGAVSGEGFFGESDALDSEDGSA